MNHSPTKKILWAIFSMVVGMGGAFVIVQGGGAVYAYVKPKIEVVILGNETVQTAVPAPIQADTEDTTLPPVQNNQIIETKQQVPAETEDASPVVSAPNTNANTGTGYPNEEAVIPKEKVQSCPKPTQNFPDYSMNNVGQTIAIPYLTYIPADLVFLPGTISLSAGTCLKKDAAEHLGEMLAGAEASGLKIRVSSGFRSFDTQEQILSHWLSIRGDEAYQRVAKPGYSEHQLGVAVDLSGESIAYTSATESFGNSPEYTWLANNAYKYGFVESYQKDKENITGYEYEPWHYRYVGIDNAALIQKENITVTEFLAEQEAKGNVNIGG